MVAKKHSLKDDLEAPPTIAYGGLCKIKTIKDSLDAEDKESLERSIERVRDSKNQTRSRAYSAIWLTKILQRNGHEISVSTVRRHINKECPCERLGE